MLVSLSSCGGIYRRNSIVRRWYWKILRKSRWLVKQSLLRSSRVSLCNHSHCGRRPRNGRPGRSHFAPSSTVTCTALICGAGTPAYRVRTAGNYQLTALVALCALMASILSPKATDDPFVLPSMSCVRCHVRTTALETEALALSAHEFRTVCRMAYISYKHFKALLKTYMFRQGYGALWHSI